jgi:hypothetical protein
MKVNIGKYPKHRWYHNFVFWHFGYEAKAKEKIVIEEFDTWSMDHTLAKIILPMLIQLKETKHGAPFVEMEDVPELLRWDMKDERHYNTKGEVDEQYFERWEYVISEMIWAFEQKCRDDWSGDYYKYEDTPEDDKSEDFSERMGLKLVWEDRKGHQEHQLRMTNGFRLFGTYFENLWD